MKNKYLTEIGFLQSILNYHLLYYAYYSETHPRIQQTIILNTLHEIVLPLDKAYNLIYGQQYREEKTCYQT